MRRAHSIAAVLSIAVALLGGSALAGSVPAGPTDRSVKLDLIAKLKHGPQILILGSSRGRQAQPSLLLRLTGHTAFNAAVTGGSAPDAWVFTRYTADLFPHQKRRYIWFLSQGITANIADPRMQEDPRGRKYLAEVAQYLSAQTVTPVPWQTDTRYHADGSIAASQSAITPAQARKVRADAAAIVARLQQHPPVAPSPDPARFKLFEHLIGYMNSLGSRPVLVLNPIYPTVFAELEKYGDPGGTAALAYLHSLQSRYDFVIVDCQNIYRWGGTAYDFTNPTHVDQTNMDRMLPYIVAHSDGALR